MKTNEQLLQEIYSHFPISEDKDETMSLLITDCLETGIDYWNTKHPKTENKTKEFYGERVWEDVKAGRSLTFGDNDNQGDLNLTNIAKALNHIKKHNPATYEDLQDENWDADVCDVFFQITIFGEVVFG